MSLKSALMQIQQEKKEKEITDIIQSMLMEQQRLLDEGCVNNTVNKDGDVVKVKKEWNPNVLHKGGITYRKVNNKWYRVSVCGNDNDIILKFKIKSALGKTISVSTRTYQEAQSVIDDIFGKGKYVVSACHL